MVETRLQKLRRTLTPQMWLQSSTGTGGVVRLVKLSQKDIEGWLPLKPSTTSKAIISPKASGDAVLHPIKISALVSNLDHLLCEKCGLKMLGVYGLIYHQIFNH